MAMMPHERRLSIRKTPDDLAYISLPSDNGGIVTDVSEGGLGFHAIAPVIEDGPIRFRFEMDSSERVEAVGELAWMDENGKTCGLRFIDLPDEVREQIRVWIRQSKWVAPSRALAGALDLPAAGRVFQAGAASHKNAELAAVVLADHPLRYNWKPAVQRASSNTLAAFPLVLDFRAGATAAVVPQFVEMLDGMAEQVRIWVAESKTKIRDNGFAAPASETEVAPRSEIESAPAVNLPMAEPEIEAEAAPVGNTGSAPVEDLPVAEPATESEVAPGGKAAAPPLAAAGNPLPLVSKPPIYVGPPNKFSLFSLGPDSETGATNIAGPQSVSVRHPIAAVGLTIALAFLFATGIFSYVCASRAGDLLFDWGEKLWGGAHSQPIPQNPASPASSVLDSSRPPQQ